MSNTLAKKVEDTLNNMYGYYNPVDYEDPSEQFYAEVGSSMSDSEQWDVVNKPQHYHKNGMEVIDIIDSFTPDSYSYYMGNAIKYLLRHQDKAAPAQDLKKCVWYVNRMIDDWQNK
jgi:hypothetical protein